MKSAKQIITELKEKGLSEKSLERAEELLFELCMLRDWVTHPLKEGLKNVGCLAMIFGVGLGLLALTHVFVQILLWLSVGIVVFFLLLTTCVMPLVRKSFPLLLNAQADKGVKTLNIMLAKDPSLYKELEDIRSIEPEIFTKIGRFINPKPN